MKTFLIALFSLVFMGQAMGAEITITIADEKVSAITDAFSVQYQRPEQVEDENGDLVDNPETKKAFTLRILKGFIRQVYKAAKVKEVDITLKNTRTAADDYTEDISVE